MFLDKQSSLSLPSHPPNKISGLEKNDYGCSLSLKGAELWSSTFHGASKGFHKKRAAEGLGPVGQGVRRVDRLLAHASQLCTRSHQLALKHVS